MRVSSTVFFQTGVKTINNQQAGLMHLYQQIGTGKRMISPSDDPLGAAQTINIAQSQSLNARFTENRQVAKTALATEENTLTSVTSLLQGIKTRLVEVGNGTLSDADRAVLGNVLSNARDNLLGLANSTDGNGQYLFSGHKGSQPPFVADASGKVVYQGDDGRRLVQVDQTRQLDSAHTGREIFTQPAAGTLNYTTAAGANTGSGVVGSPSITDPQGAYVGDAFQVKFEAGATPGELQYTVSRVDGSGALIPPASSATPVSKDTAVLNLFGQLQVKFSGTPEVGDTFTIEPAFEPNTHAVTASDLAPGAIIGKPVVVDPTGVNVSKVIDVTFADNAGTLEYVVTVDGVPEPAQPYVAPADGLFDLGEGMKVALSGTPVDGNSFTVKPVEPAPANLNIFDALDAMIKALETPTGNPTAAANFSNALNATMQRVDVTYDQVLTVRSSVGTLLNEIDAIDGNSSMRGLGYAKDLQRLEEVDWYNATAQLQLRTAALEAASLAFKKIQATSLFNMGNG